MVKYLPIELLESEKQDIISLSKISPSFNEHILQNKNDYTNVLFGEIGYFLNGNIPRNFVINIGGLVGRFTGIFKTSLGLQIAMKNDPYFNVKERLAFTPNQLNEKIKKYGSDVRKAIFVLDERTKDLKKSAVMRLSNIIETCRERQFCFILIGVDDNEFTISDYILGRMGESDDKYLPKKTVYYSVKKKIEKRTMYRGYIKHNIIPLSNKRWNKVWNIEYMKLKQEFQQLAIDQKITAMPLKQIALEFMKRNNFLDCINEKGKLNKQSLRREVYKSFSDVTSDERNYIYSEVVDLYSKLNLN